MARELFDPSRPLVARTYIRLHGTIYTKDVAVPYAEADHRILKRLYDQRKINHGEGEEHVPTTPRQTFLRQNTERRVVDREAKEAAAEADLKAQSDEPTGEEEAAVKTLMGSNTHDELFTKASGVAGVTKTMKKAEIALALVRAGRGPA